MPPYHRYLEDQRLCLVRYEGRMDGDDFIEADQQIFRAVCGENVRFLFDMRTVHITGGAETARRYATWISELDLPHTHPGIRQAIVVDDPQDTGLSMLMTAISAPDLEMMIFSSLEAACHSIGVDPEILEEHRDLIRAQ